MSGSSQSHPHPHKAVTTPTQPSAPTPSFSFKLAEHRYGREEMLALLNPSLPMPEVLTLFPALFRDRVMTPLSFSPLSEDEQRAQALGVNSNVVLKMMGRSGRGQGRGGIRIGRGGKRDVAAFQRLVLEDGGEERELDAGRPRIRSDSTRSGHMSNWRTSTTPEEEEDLLGGGSSPTKPQDSWQVVAPKHSWREPAERQRSHSEKTDSKEPSTAKSGPSKSQSNATTPDAEVPVIRKTPKVPDGKDNKGSKSEVKLENVEEVAEVKKAEKTVKTVTPPLPPSETKKQTDTETVQNELSNLSVKENDKPKEKEKEKETAAIEESSIKKTVASVPKLYGAGRGQARNVSMSKMPPSSVHVGVPGFSGVLPREKKPVEKQPDVVRTPDEDFMLKGLELSTKSLVDGVFGEEEEAEVEEKQREEKHQSSPETISKKQTPSQLPVPEKKPSISHSLPPPPVLMTGPSPGRYPLPESFTKWFYLDPQCDVQGPFSGLEMFEWFNSGYFAMSLPVRRACDEDFKTLGEMIKLYGGVPFAPGTGPPPPPPFRKVTSEEWNMMAAQQQAFVQFQQQQQQLFHHQQNQQKQQPAQQQQKEKKQKTESRKDSKESMPSEDHQSPNRANSNVQKSPVWTPVDNQAKSVSPRGEILPTIWGAPPAPAPAAVAATVSVWNDSSGRERKEKAAEAAREAARIKREIEVEEEEKQKKKEAEEEEKRKRRQREEEEERERQKRVEEERLKREEEERQRHEEEEKWKQEQEKKRREELLERKRKKEEQEEMKRLQEEAQKQQQIALQKQREAAKQKQVAQQQRQLQALNRLQSEQTEEMKKRQQLSQRLPKMQSSNWSAQSPQLSLLEIQQQQEKQMATEREQVRHQVQHQQQQQQESLHQTSWSHLSSGAPSLLDIQQEQSTLSKDTPPKLTQAQRIQTAPSVPGKDIWGSGGVEPFSGVWGLSSVPAGISETKSQSGLASFWEESLASIEDKPPTSVSLPKAKSKQQEKKKAPLKTESRKPNKDEERVRRHFQTAAESVADERLRNWCEKKLQPFERVVDISGFVSFLTTLDNATEIREYIDAYLGTSAAAKDFSRGFLERHASVKTPTVAEILKGKSSQCTPPPADSLAAFPSLSDVGSTMPASLDHESGSGFQQVSDVGKKGRKKRRKVQKVDASSLLAYSVTSADRRNQGEVKSAYDVT
eukprot:m.225073 g.225073  ORF g.225073 m.225073 type:complete len:1186 (+) comp40007_c2_seq49:326-3883(+)